MLPPPSFFFFFFFNDTATTEIYTLSLHDALPIFVLIVIVYLLDLGLLFFVFLGLFGLLIDRKSTRLNSSHLVISYAVFCLKKKKKTRDLYLCVVIRRWCGCTLHVFDTACVRSAIR